MGKKIVWLVVSCMMALSLVMTSCGGAEEEEEEVVVEEEEEEVVVEEEEEEVVVEEEEEEEEVVVSEDKPQYGGWLTVTFMMDIRDFDEVTGFHASPATAIQSYCEELWTGDWARGPAGTDEVTWDMGGNDVWEYKTGAIAESWDLTDPTTLVWNIRQGIYWHTNPENPRGCNAVGGRMLTADDVVWSLSQYRDNPRCYIHSQPGMADVGITAEGNSVIMELASPNDKATAVMRYADFASIVPREVYEELDGMQDWRNHCGTGPYMITDFVAGSALTVKANPNYWKTNPCGPGEGDQLPYLAGIRWLIIGDASTREAAFRTGQLDVGSATWETFPQFMEENPDLQWSSSIFDGGFNTHFNLDHPVLSQKDVRRAFMMAIDWDSIVNDLYGGTAVLNTWPATYNPAYGALFLPIDEAPASVQELWSHDLAAAQALMDGAGLSAGLEVTIVCENSAAQVDLLSIYKDMLEDINVTLNLDTKETGTWTNIYRTMNWDEMCYSSMGGLSSQLASLTNIYGPGFANASGIEGDALIEAAFNEIQTDLASGNQNAAMAAHKALMAHVLDQAYAIPTPKAPGYTLWWPWVKNYLGEYSMGNWNANSWVDYVWVDEELKDSLGY